jgi:hypothetical protein
MTHEETLQFVGEILRNFSSFSSNVGGLEFYGVTPEFKNVLRTCRDIIGEQPPENIYLRQVYIFLDDHHGKTSIAKALDIEAKMKGIQSFYFDGIAKVTQKDLLDLRESRGAVTLIDGLPESAQQRGTVLERFNALAGRAILFCQPEYQSDARMSEEIQTITLSHVDERPIDKLAWLIGLIRELLRSEMGTVPENLEKVTSQLPAATLMALTKVKLGPRIKELSKFAATCAEMIRFRAESNPNERVTPEDLTGVFLDFFAPPTPGLAPGFRVWVEGEMDSRLLKLVSKLAHAAGCSNLEEGLSITPLGLGREGGTDRISAIVVEKGTRRNKDLFLLDCDEPGRHAKEKLHILEQDSLLLDPQLSCSRCDTEVEIEDFISLSCLDRFYEQHQNYLPEKEIIKYKVPPARRLVVEGPHKDALVEWLEANALFSDVENMFFLFCQIRDRFSLRNPLSQNEMIGWRKRLKVELDPAKHLGNRPKHWPPT